MLELYEDCKEFLDDIFVKLLDGLMFTMEQFNISSILMELSKKPRDTAAISVKMMNAALGEDHKLKGWQRGFQFWLKEHPEEAWARFKVKEESIRREKPSEEVDDSTDLTSDFR